MSIEEYKQFKGINLNTIPEKVQEKLTVLQKSIDQEPIPELSELTDNEVNQLKNLAQETQIEMYIQIKKAFIQQFRGRVDIRGESGLIWNEREIELDLFNKVLLISRQNKDQEKYTYKLQDYFIKWVGLKANRYCFEIYNDEKQVLIGNSEENAKKWFSNIESWCKRVKQQKRSSLIQQESKEQIQYDIPLMFQGVTQKYTREYFFDDTNYHLHTFENKLKLLQKSNCYFKVYLIIENHSINQIVASIISQQLIWNDSLKSQNIICDIDQTALIKEKRSNVSFQYMRYLHMGKQQFIVDKSIDDHSKYPLKCKIIESVWTFYEQNNQVLCVNITNYEPTILQFSISNHLASFQKLQQHLDYNIQASALPSFYLLIDNYDLIQNRYQLIEEQQNQQGKIDNLKEEEAQIGNFPELVWQANESKEQFLRKLLKESTSYSKIWQSQIHDYIIQPVDPPKNPLKDVSMRQQIYNTFYDIHPGGGVYLIDKIKKKVYNDVGSYMIKKMSTNLLEGKNVLNISLPVSVFDKRSNLERYCQQHLLFPNFIENLDQQSPVEAIKNMLAYAITCSLQLLSMDKPFNPILGETFQAWINGCPIYAEQISHHPPITAVQLYGRTFKLCHHFETQVVLKLPNGAFGREYGYMVMETKNNKYVLKIASATLFGLLYGDKYLVWSVPFWIIDQKNKLIAQGNPDWERSMLFNSNNNPIDTLNGGVYEIDDAEIQRFNKMGYYDYDGIKEGQFKKVAKLSGRWTSKLFMDDEEFLNWDKIYGYKLEYEKEPLASDSKYREDVIAWMLDDFDVAMERKEKLENIQRADRKWRAQLGPQSQKH